MEYPEIINIILQEYGFNRAEKIEHEGNKYWSLGLVDDDGEPIPTGLPVIYHENDDGKFIQLNYDQALQLLSNL